MKSARTSLLLCLCLFGCENSQVRSQDRTETSSTKSLFTKAKTAGEMADQVLTLEAQELSLTLDLSRGGGIRSLKYRSLDVVSTQYDHPTIFAIDVVRGQRVRRFDNRDFLSFRHEELPEGVRLVYSGLPETALEIELVIRAKGDYLAFQSDVRCGPETVCATFEYPYVSGYESLGSDPTKDHYILPHLGGQDNGRSNQARPMCRLMWLVLLPSGAS